MPRKVRPDVQEYYDSLTDDEKVDLDKRIDLAGRVLADMRMTAKGTLDQRYLTPKTFFQQIQTTPKVKDPKSGLFVSTKETVEYNPKDKLPKGMDLAAYIRQQTGEGKLLADYYIKILAMSQPECKRLGVYPNHKDNAGKWLAERGWGKPKSDEKEPGITINVVNHAEAKTQPPPTRQVEVLDASPAAAESDAGKDQPSVYAQAFPNASVLMDLHDKPNSHDKDLEVEETFDLTEDR